MLYVLYTYIYIFIIRLIKKTLKYSKLSVVIKLLTK